MNHDGLGPRDLPGGEPEGTDGDVRPTEQRLRRALDEDARSITPTERLEAILGEARAESSSASRPSASGFSDVSQPRHRRWLLPAAAAAAALLVAGTLWAVNRPATQAPTVAGTSASPATQPPSSSRPSGAPSSIPTQSAERPSATGPGGSAPPAASVTVGVPVYYVGPLAAGADRVRLFREFVPTPVAAPATDTAEALAALRLAMGAPPAGSSYRSAWTGVVAQSVGLAPDAIAVRLSSGTTDPQPLATEQLVWTVQAALGSVLPVRFELADGGTQVSPGHPASSSYTRPSDPMLVLDVLAPIWVDEPARGSVVKAGAPLTVKGVASVFEGTVQWELLRGGTRVDGGFTTAAQSAPARAAYTFATKPLTAGDYVLRVYATSPKDGSTMAEQRVPFTAR